MRTRALAVFSIGLVALVAVPAAQRYAVTTPVSTATASWGLTNSATSDVVATAADTYLTGSSLAIGAAQMAGTVLRWRIVATKTAAGVGAGVFSVRFGTAGTTADTARNTFTLSAQTAATDTGQFDLMCIVRSVNATTGAVQCVLGVIHQNSTTGLVSSNETGVFQVLSANFDNTSTSLIAGVSVNPGTAGVWTFQFVLAEARNLQ